MSILAKDTPGVPPPPHAARFRATCEFYTDEHRALAEKQEPTEEDLEAELEAAKAMRGNGRSLCRSFGFNKSRNLEQAAQASPRESHDYHDGQVAAQLQAANLKQTQELAGTLAAGALQE
jgi:hypothetical protein